MICATVGSSHSTERILVGYFTVWSGDLGWDLPPDMPTVLLPLPTFDVPCDPVERAKDPHVLRVVLHALRRL